MDKSGIISQYFQRGFNVTIFTMKIRALQTVINKMFNNHKLVIILDTIKKDLFYPWPRYNLMCSNFSASSYFSYLFLVLFGKCTPLLVQIFKSLFIFSLAFLFTLEITIL